MKDLFRRYIYSILFFGWIIIISLLSVLPANGVIERSNGSGNFRWDYLEHAGVFFILALLYGVWLKRCRKDFTRRKFWRMLFFGSLVAILTELLQFFVEGRTVNPLDILFNLLGLGMGLILYYYLSFRRDGRS